MECESRWFLQADCKPAAHGEWFDSTTLHKQGVEDANMTSTEAHYEPLPYNPGTHTDLMTLLSEVRYASVAQQLEVLLADNPKQGQMGFVVGDQEYNIAIRDVRKSLDRGSVPAAVLEMLKTGSGRLALARSLASVSASIYPL